MLGAILGAAATAAGVATGNPALIAAGVTGGLAAFGQERTNAQNAQLARQQMDFQAQMSGTSYQRAVADMMAAGLNPMLAYSQGGASTPGGQTAVMQNALGAGATSATQGYQTALNAALNVADIKLKGEQAGAAGAQEDLNRANMNLALVEAANKSAQLPGHQQFGKQVASIIQQNNAIAASNTAQAAQRNAELPESQAIGKLYSGEKGVYIKGAERVGQAAAGLGIGASSATSAASNLFRPDQGLDPRPRPGRR
jgi:hypothetical protein